jgi:hypothetical protein
MYQMFNKTNEVRFNVYVYRTDVLSNHLKYNFKTDIDGQYTYINSVYVGVPNELNDIGYINPMNDSLKLYTSCVPFTYELSSMS